ncbi:hypothetical protein AKJ52_02775 [candidate division MSBL1 archaeon SCGC-AAA382C18]|uniref:Uncharacterized protein n=1 Tax=candidate division MSBL1 archaeon SCGC-AAA382C18 TaxID=1698281 RepID=A0A133VHQ8_9EURY|nr:hypothetical protein AKJ52_02775 [candidate division MSBL1 archaeon SCGC-AAA382C18]
MSHFQGLVIASTLPRKPRPGREIVKSFINDYPELLFLTENHIYSCIDKLEKEKGLVEVLQSESRKSKVNYKLTEVGLGWKRFLEEVKIQFDKETRWNRLFNQKDIDFLKRLRLIEEKGKEIELDQFSETARRNPKGRIEKLSKLRLLEKNENENKIELSKDRCEIFILLTEGKSLEEDKEKLPKIDYTNSV